MSEAVCAVLLGITVLSIKHMIADFFLQTGYQFRNKGTYGHPGGILHAGIHIAMTPPVFLVLPPSSASLAIAILAGEFVVHYHLDWAKEQLIDRNELTQTDPWFWHLFGLDQFGHALTYIVIVALLVY